MPRAGLSTAAVVDAALHLLDERGPDGLTLAAVAARTGVAAPSLYKHVGSLADLRTRVGVRVVVEMTERFGAAVMGRGGDEAVAAVMHAYRDYVREYPHRYAAMPPDASHEPGFAAAAARLLEVLLAVLRGYGLSDTDAVHAARCLRATVHGFTSIEASGGFGLPEDVNETYERLIGMFTASLPHDFTPHRR